MSTARLDILLVTRGLAVTRSKAQALIKAGLVSVDGKPTTKSSVDVAEESMVEVAGIDHPWVSRGGMKLAHALEHFAINVKGMVAIDVGASTGGFTDVLLHYGATKIYAVDVGRDQLNSKLRLDARVVSLEQTNARELTAALIPERADMVVCDASFISLAKVLPAALVLTKPAAQLVTLIKPQFEVGKGAADKGKGVIRDSSLHSAVCDDVSQWLKNVGWNVAGIIPSPITGPKGNTEFLLYARKAG